MAESKTVDSKYVLESDDSMSLLLSNKKDEAKIPIPWGEVSVVTLIEFMSQIEHAIARLTGFKIESEPDENIEIGKVIRNVDTDELLKWDGKDWVKLEKKK